MQVIPFVYHSIDEIISNTYIFVDDDKNCVVIDPSVDNNGIVDYIAKNELNLKGILITHAHFDHIGGVSRLSKAYPCPIYAGYEELDSFKDPYKNCSEGYSPRGIVVLEPVTPLGDNEVLHLLKEDIKVIYTPYHTSGSVCYYFKDSKVIFTGDSLFNFAFGRSDLPTSVPSKQDESIAKLMKLEDDVKVYPGHGRFTSIGNERRFIYRHM